MDLEKMEFDKTYDPGINDLTSESMNDALRAPIYTVPRHSEEYELQRQEQYCQGLETLLEAIAIFGGALLIYFLFSWLF